MAGEQRWARCVCRLPREGAVRCSFGGGGGGASLWICILLMTNIFLRRLGSNVGAEPSDQEKQALLRFLKENNLDLCPEVASWNTREDTPCDWIRVFCNSNGSAVHKLDLSACSNSGIQLDELSNLEGLQELDLSSNSYSRFDRYVADLHVVPGLKWLDISGGGFAGPGDMWPSIIYRNMSALHSLQYLYATGTGFTEPWSHIPSLQQLVSLSLANISLEGVIPDQVRSLTKLVSLDLSHNKLEGSIPNLESLTRLTHLSLTQNKYLNGSVPTAPNLKYLDAAENNFTELTDSFFQMSALEKVDLSENRLYNVQLPNTTGLNLPSLERLDLSRNRMMGPIPSGLGNVSFLDLSHNNFSGPIPQDIRVFPPVEGPGGDVDLSANRLNGSIPASLLYGARRLKLSKNSLVGTIPDAPLRALETDVDGTITYSRVLDLSGNQLDGPIPSSFSHYVSNHSFESLCLQNNLLSGDLIFLLNQTNILRATSILVQGNRFTGDLTNLLHSWTQSSDGGFGPSILDLSHNYFNMTPSGEFPNPLQTMLESRLCHSVVMTELRLAGTDLMGKPLPDGFNCRLEPRAHGSLKILELQFCNLSGPVPVRFFDIMPTMYILNVSNNRLSGAIPESLPYTLRALDLSNNSLEGEIPSELFTTRLPNLLHFNASNNNLAGSIPRSFSLTLEVLDLSHNNLTGEIPGKLFFGLPNLKRINLSGNKLSGRIPEGLPPALNNASSFADNPGLCGEPLRAPCITPGAAGIKLWLLVTVVVASSALVCTASCLLLVWRWRVYSKQHQQDADLIATLLERETVTVMPLRELRRATSNFSESAQIGKGGFGTVYSGKLADGTEVAIKKGKKEGSPEYKQQFLNEVKILSGVNHRHLVKLLGCSMESKIALLVFEFVPNGTLKEHLQGKRPGSSPLSWRQRLLIALQTSDALAYLHSSADPPIFHRDVKSSNILLDHDLNAKVADFGISKLAPSKAATHVSTVAIQGTRGYIDPEYYASFQLTPKSDVYSFGVVLLELISAKPAVDFGRQYDETSLANLALSAMERGEWEELIDPVLADTYRSTSGKASIDSVGALAVRCLASRSRERPEMREVWKELQTVWLPSDSDASCQSDHVFPYLQRHNAYRDVSPSHGCMSPQTPHASLGSSCSTY